MIIKIFFKNGDVQIIPFDYFYANHDELVLEQKESSTVFDRSKIKNYTVYLESGQQIHTTYSKHKYETKDMQTNPNMW
jgi:hypothetical protein